MSDLGTSALSICISNVAQSRQNWCISFKHSVPTFISQSLLLSLSQFEQRARKMGSLPPNDLKSNPTYNAPAPQAPYFTPNHAVSPGTPFDPNSKIPTLFTPLKIRDATLRNRIIVAPMCQCADTSVPQTSSKILTFPRLDGT